MISTPTQPSNIREYCIEQRFAVPFTYPVHFTRDLFAQSNPLLSNTLNRLDENRRHRVAVYLDSGVANAFPKLVEHIELHANAHAATIELVAPPRILPGGETLKNDWQGVHAILSDVADTGLDRQSYILAVGGGSFLDVAGLAAAIAHRGLRLVRAPTTTLAQADAGIGVKNGLNAFGRKNFVGAFAPPFAVLNDCDFLRTLDTANWLGGVAEAFKVALIRDAHLFDMLESQAENIIRRDLACMAAIIRRTAELHLAHIVNAGDPFEFGSARPLDFGHWAAHALESMSAYAIRHGQAVAVGMALDCAYATEIGRLTPGQLERILSAMTSCGLPIACKALGRRKADGTLEVLEGIEQFREHLGGVLNVTLPENIGKASEIHAIDPVIIERCVNQLMSR